MPHEDWNKAQERLERIAGKRRKLRPKQQRLRPIQRGRLTGYIPINPIWTTLSHARLISATEKVLAKTHFNEIIMPVQKRSEESEDTTMAILEGFEVINLVESKGESVMTVSSTSLKFNKATAVELNYAPYIRMLVNAKENKVAIQPCTAKDPNAIEFSKPEGEQSYAIVVKLPALLVEFRRLFAFEEDGQKLSYTLNGTLYPEEQVIIYDVNEASKAQPRKTAGRKKKVKAEQEAE